MRKGVKDSIAPKDTSITNLTNELKLVKNQSLVFKNMWLSTGNELIIVTQNLSAANVTIESNKSTINSLNVKLEEMDKLVIENYKLTNDIISLQEEYKTLNYNYDIIKADIEENVTINQLTRETNSQKDTIFNLNNINSVHTQTQIELESINTSLESKNTSLKSKNTSLESENTSLERNIIIAGSLALVTPMISGIVLWKQLRK